MPPAKDPDPSNPLAVWGAELRYYRKAAELNQQQLAERVNYSLATISSVETARRRPSEDLATRCDDALNTGGALARLLDRLSDLILFAMHPAWFAEWLEIEREAGRLRTFQPSYVPGLLQTEAYTRALFRAGRPMDTDEQVETLVAARMERQALLTGSKPPKYYVVLDEAVLMRPLGGPVLMAEQLDKLLEAAANRLVELQVIPLGVGAHAAQGGGFVIATTPDGPDVVYRDNIGEGHVVGVPEIVATVSGLWDSLRSDALPRRESIDPVRSWAEKWKTSS